MTFRIAFKLLKFIFDKKGSRRNEVDDLQVRKKKHRKELRQFRQ